MKTELKQINKENPYLKILNNPEDPGIKISTTHQTYSQPKNVGAVESVIIQIEIHYSNQNPVLKLFNVSNLTEETLPSLSDLMPAVNSANIECVILNLEKCDFDFYQIDLIIQSGRDLIDIKNPIESFHRHLNDRANTKILFSGPFGQGKTTFLDHYFYGESVVNDKYEVFKVFPVNYSVASNEDIFKYIKTDILFQLLAKDIEFDKSEMSIISSFEEYIYLNPKKAILSFLKNASHLNAKTEAIAKVVESLNEFLKPIFTYHKKNNVDDKELAIDYLKDIYEKEGSLFEDNFYTQLIRQLLERLVTDTRKENVLIIEDLDRMDPDHIFRILNVISAHYDNYNFNGNENHHNKFGFDKIILVCDVKNIENIFHHKYGAKTDFGGYMNKYFSTKPFEYDNKVMMTHVLIKMEENFIQNRYRYANNITNLFDVFHKILIDMIFANKLSLRQVLKLVRIDFFARFDELRGNYSSDSHYFSQSPFLIVLDWFKFSGLYESLLIFLENPISNKENWKNSNYLTQLGMISLVEHDKNRIINNAKYLYKGINYTFNINWNDKSFGTCIDFVGANNTPSNFKDADFYEIMKSNVEIYNLIGQFQ